MGKVLTFKCSLERYQPLRWLLVLPLSKKYGNRKLIYFLSIHTKSDIRKFFCQEVFSMVRQKKLEEKHLEKMYKKALFLS